MIEFSAEDIADFRASARAAFGGTENSARVRELMATREGWDRADWRKVAADLDLPAVMLPTSAGGAGLSAWELGFAFEEAGYTSACLPLFSTAALAVPLLMALGDEEALHRYGPRLASGELTMTVAFTETEGSWDPDQISTVATSTDERWTITGSEAHVVDGATADVLLVIARTHPDEIGVFAVEPSEAVTRTPLVTLDQTRKIARVEFRAAPAIRIGAADARPALAKAMAVSRALLAAEQVGGAQRCLDMTADYARTRFQFGRPIGSFQAIKQRLADVLIQVESARSAAYAATRAAAEDPDELELTSRIASLTAGESFIFAASQAIQLHGGIGFTWEHDAHLFYKRARSSAVLLGSGSHHVDVIARHIESTSE